jgi:3-deoxy-manno-octulosonate cytidylyltransferase (CMP-KDO synthetase)
MFSKPSIIGIIPARYASSRFPGKMLAPINGKSLIQHTYENAQRSKDFKELLVLTEDQRIKEHVTSFGGRALMTSASCQTGTDRIVEALTLYPELQEYDYVVNIQGDEPMLDTRVVREALELLYEDPEAVVSTAVVRIRTQEEAMSPSCVKCVMDLKGNALYFSRSLIPYNRETSFDFTSYYRHLGLYCFRGDFLLQYNDLCPTPLQMIESLEQLKILEHGFRIKVATVSEQYASHAVDVPDDIQRIEKLLCR